VAKLCRFFDVRSPLAEYISILPSYVILQRINLGLFAVLGELSRPRTGEPSRRRCGRPFGD
jgi:hypothetical protein